MNGKERNLSLFRKLSAYIMQDNQLHSNLTVEEAMNVAANLKLSQKVQRGEKLSVVSIELVMNKQTSIIAPFSSEVEFPISISTKKSVKLRIFSRN